MIIETALRIALDAHSKQVDKGGEEYILHPLQIASKFKHTYEKATAILHDVLEDSDKIVPDDLLHYGIPLEVVTAVVALTRNKNEDYFDYIKRINKNILATRIKIEDLKHNLDSSRLLGMTVDDVRRMNKYLKALDILEGR